MNDLAYTPTDALAAVQVSAGFAAAVQQVIEPWHPVQVGAGLATTVWQSIELRPPSHGNPSRSRLVQASPPPNKRLSNSGPPITAWALPPPSPARERHVVRERRTKQTTINLETCACRRRTATRRQKRKNTTTNLWTTGQGCGWRPKQKIRQPTCERLGVRWTNQRTPNPPTASPDFSDDDAWTTTPGDDAGRSTPGRRRRTTPGGHRNDNAVTTPGRRRRKDDARTTTLG